MVWERRSGLALAEPPTPTTPPAPHKAPLLRTWWRRLTMMRTAIILLGLLAAAAIPGSLFPQRGADLARVQDFLIAHKTIGPILDRLSMFDVFAAPWFAAIYLLLMISLIGCLVPRTKHHLAVLREKPHPVSAAGKAWETLTLDQPVEEVRSAINRELRWWQRSSNDLGVAAGKGKLRETGNLAFHTALLVLLIGIGIGSVRGFEGDRVLVESSGLSSGLSSGSYLTNSSSQYDALRPGRLFGSGDLSPWTLQLEKFDATYQPDSNTPKDYIAKVRWSKDHQTWHTVDVKVNDPLDIGGDKLYLLNHGYAPIFTLRDARGRAVATQPVVCPTIAPAVGLARCVFKVPGLPLAADGSKQDLGFRMTFAPTAVFSSTTGVTSSNPRLDNPDVLVTAFVGDLGQGAAGESVYTLDPTLMKQSVTDNLVLKDPARSTLKGLPGGYTLSVTGVQQWASVRVKRDPGKPLVLFAAITAILGVATSLSLRRRRVWARLTPQGTRTLVEVGAQPRSDRDREAATRDVEKLVQALRTGRPKP